MTVSDKNNDRICYIDEVNWTCPACHHIAIRFDSQNQLFVCWECCAILTVDEGIKLVGDWSVEVHKRVL